MTQTAKYEYFSQDPEFPAKLIVATLFIGAFLGYLNETLLNVALTHLTSDFGVERYVVQWLSTGFLLVMGALTPISASVLAWFRTRDLALFALGIFLAGSLICAFATSFWMLFAGRIVQAVFAALAVPLLINAVLAIYPPEKRGVAMGLVTVIFTAAPALGPTLSGIITQHLGWRYLFLATVPFTLAAMAIVWFRLRIDLNEITRPRIDALSVLLCMGGFGLLVYTISEFIVLSAFATSAAFAGAFALIFLFALRQFRLREPLLNLRVFAHSQFALCAAILALANFVFLGLELMMPMFMQQVLAFSATLTGLVLLPASLAEALAAPTFGALLDKKGARATIIPGTALMLAATCALWAYAGLEANAAVLAAIFALFAVSVAGAVTGETHGLNSIPKRLNPHGTAVITTIGPLCGAMGAAFFVGAMDAAEDAAKLAGKAAQTAGVDGAHAALGLACVASAAIFLLSLRVKNFKFDGAR